MHRDPLPLPLKRQLSRGSSSKFFYLADGIAKYNEPTQTQLGALERSYTATGQFVMESDEFRDFTMTVHAQGSRAIGTIIRPMRFRPAPCLHACAGRAAPARTPRRPSGR